MKLLLESIRNNLRFAVRHFARRPLSVATIVAVLAIGIGVHSAVFTLVQAVTVRPAPGVPRDANLVRVRGREAPARGGMLMPRGFSYPELLDIAARRDVFTSVAGWTLETVTLDVDADDTDDTDASARAQFVTGNYFTTLAIRPSIGVGLPATDRADRSEPELVAVLGHSLWKTSFGGEPDVVGRIVRVNDVPVRIVGVAPERFNGATRTEGNRTLWMPLSARASIMRSRALSLTSRDTALLQSVARLAQSSSLERANAAVRVISERAVSQMRPTTDETKRDADVVPLRGDTDLPANDEAAMYATVYGSVALLILLIACTNVSALVVGSAVARKQEITVRLSLGASRARLIRQLLTESTLLAAFGGALGLTLYWWTVSFAASRFPDLDMSPDMATVAFTMCFALGTGILFGISPALHATRNGLSETLKQSTAGTTGRSRLQRSFVVAQIVLTQPLLVALALMLGSLLSDTSNTVNDAVARSVISLRLNVRGAAGSTETNNNALASSVQRIAQLPGVMGVVAEPFGIRNTTLDVRPEDRLHTEASGSVNVHMEATGPGYFSLIDVPIVRGRDLAWTDTTASAVPVIIGSDMAHALWGTTDPIGKRFDERIRGAAAARQVIVIGVFDSRIQTTRGNDGRVFTLLTGQAARSFLIRTSVPAKSVVASVRSQIKNDVPFIPIERLLTLDDVLLESAASAFRVSAAAAAGGALTLLMAAIGLYGVVALMLAQRRRELGVRMALGAKPRQVVGMLFASGARLSVLGLVLGLPLSVLALRILAGMVTLPKFSTTLLAGSIAAVVLAVAGTATWIPARRAATIDPATALRVD